GKNHIRVPTARDKIKKKGTRITMDHKFDMDEIEESLRICQELLADNPEYVSHSKKTITSPEIIDKPDLEVKPELEDNSKVQSVIEDNLEPEISTTPKNQVKPDIHPEVKKKAKEGVKPKEKKKVEEKENPKTEEKEEQISEEAENEQKISWKRTLIAFGICVLVAIGIALIITNFVASHTKVDGISMESTLEDGDDIIVEKFSYLTNEPERYDIIVFHQSDTENYIKRVIALPGERIQITEGKIYINDRAVFDAYGNTKMEDGGIAEKPIKLGEDEYFVLGDNRNASKDSRDKAVGVIKREQIIGKAWLRVMPFENFGKLE
ncbi:MAG: signal peptidase I, partial [Clostridiales bacterium]|nr:signal peptidase I [Clostridiales bacterium]